MNQPLASRRIVFQGLSALGVATVLAGCGGDDEPSSSSPTTEPSSPSDSSSSPAEPPPSSASPSRTKKPAGPTLATTDEIPVGGGIVLMDERIVIAQPTAGEFVAWSAICKHEGETVGSVEDNVIICPYHGSRYDAATGDVVGGPAPSGLDPVQITVTKGRITLA
jgi:Rieske Fe-S protein